MSISSDPAILINQLPVSVEIPKDVEITEIVSLLYKRIARAVNTKEGSLYDLVEQGNFKSFFTTATPFVYRDVYRKTFDVVALNLGNIPGGATVVFPHNIVGLKFTALIYASCTSVAGDFFTVVYPQATMDTVNIKFTNPLVVALNAVYFVAEYLKT